MDAWLTLVPIAAAACALLVALLALTIDRSRRSRTAAGWLLAACVAGVLVLTLAGLGDGAGGVNLVPGSTIAEQLTNPAYPLGTLNLLGNVAVFAPLGWLVALLASRHRVALAATIGVGMSATIEVAQSLVGRVADVDDVILNGLSAVLGATLAVALRAASARWRAPRAREAAPA